MRHTLPMPDKPERWPFLYGRHDAMITLKRIIKGGAPILYIVHDDDGYQFLDGEPCTEEDGAVVGLEAMLNIDPTLAEIACLPPGFCASRKEATGPWSVWLREEDEEESAQ